MFSLSIFIRDLFSGLQSFHGAMFLYKTASSMPVSNCTITLFWDSFPCCNWFRSASSPTLLLSHRFLGVFREFSVSWLIVISSKLDCWCQCSPYELLSIINYKLLGVVLNTFDSTVTIKLDYVISCASP